MKRFMAYALVLLWAGGCGSTGQAEVEYPANASGTAGSFLVGDYTVTLDTARVAFGPAYFCATRAASSSLCPTAVNELATVAEIDALDPAPQPIGTVRGTVGAIRSVHHGWGLTWFPRQSSAGPADPTLPEHSALLAGTVSRATMTSFRFTATLDVAPKHQGELPVQGHRVQADVSSDTTGLHLTVDPRGWFTQVDLSALEALGLAEIELQPDTAPYDALVLGLTTAESVAFAWSSSSKGAP